MLEVIKVFWFKIVEDTEGDPWCFPLQELIRAADVNENFSFVSSGRGFKARLINK